MFAGVSFVLIFLEKKKIKFRTELETEYGLKAENKEDEKMKEQTQKMEKAEGGKGMVSGIVSYARSHREVQCSVHVRICISFANCIDANMYLQCVFPIFSFFC